MKALSILSLSIILCSCGASWHIKRAENHIAKAEAMGVKWREQTKVDTVFMDIPDSDPGMEMDSTFDLSGSDKPDTVYITKENIVTKVVINTVKGKAYVKTIEKPTTKYIRVPVTVHKTVTRTLRAGLALWQQIGLGIFFFLLGFMVCDLYHRFRRKPAP